MTHLGDERTAVGDAGGSLMGAPSGFVEKGGKERGARGIMCVPYQVCVLPQQDQSCYMLTLTAHAAQDILALMHLISRHFFWPLQSDWTP